MAQMREIGKTHTSVFTDDDGWTKVVYHSTIVVKWNSHKIVLSTGGWFTATTKARMNQASNQYQLGYTVVQRGGEWFVITDSRIKAASSETKFNGETLGLERA